MVAKAGMVEELNMISLSFWHSYVRVKVDVDVDKPLTRGTKMFNGKGDVIFIPFQ